MPGKRKTATKLELFYIQSNPNGQTAQELADELGLFKTTVEKIQGDVPPPQIEEETIPEREPKVNRMNGTILHNKKKGEEHLPGKVAILTPEAGGILDDTFKLARAKAKRPENQVGIAKPYPDRG